MEGIGDATMEGVFVFFSARSREASTTGTDRVAEELVDSALAETFFLGLGFAFGAGGLANKSL